MGSHSYSVLPVCWRLPCLYIMALSVNQGLFEAYAFYAAVIIAKVLAMSLLTARQRFRTRTFISSEDIAGKENMGFTTGANEDVERVRRAHQNDIENIFPFLILGLLYIFTNPELATATVVYLLVVPQPARALAFFGGLGVNIYLAYKVIS